jgi:hypothetical protein
MRAIMDESALFDVPDEWWVRRRCQVCGQALRVTHTHTYVVQRQVWIKIGATNKPRRRINELARPAWRQHILYPRGMDWYAPLHTHAIIEADIEHRAHDLFAEYHVIGEWFTDNPTIRRWIKEATRA